MPELSAEGRRKLEEVAARHGVGAASAEALLMALAAGGGSQAQFNIAELGGAGQWQRGGMVMVGDMFNNALKARVDALASELAGLAGASGAFAPPSQAQGAGVFVSAGSGGWWPADLGTPSATGAQNDMRYAFFPAARRLAISLGGRVTVYDTGDHQLGGFSQQQSGDQSLSFSSGHGPVRLADLAVVSADGAPAPPDVPVPGAPPPAAPVPGGRGSDEILGAIERMAELHARGVLTAQEFEAKKTELLARL